MTQPQILELFDQNRTDYSDVALPRPVRLHVWNPPAPSADAPPAVLISHGTGGAAEQMAWLAEPLADAGFVAIAIDHHGNSSAGGYLAQGFTFLWDRPRDLSFALSALARHRRLGPVGAAGFSAGGYTAAALLGARIDGEAVRAVLDGRIPVPEIPEFPGLLVALHAAVPAEQLMSRLADAGQNLTDQRVRAAFLICPGVGQLLTEESLAAIRRPVRIRWGDADTITPPDDDALRYLAAIPGAVGSSAGPDVEHYHFLGDNPDGGEVRKQVAADAVEFFLAELTGG